MLRSGGSLGDALKKSWESGTSDRSDFLDKNIYANNYQIFEAVYGMKQKAEKEEKERKENANNLFLNMRGFLILGRIFGIIPVSGIFGNTYASLSFNFPAISNMVVAAIIAFSAVLAIMETVKLPKSNALDIAQSIQGTTFKVWGLFCYIYFIVRAERFMKIFKIWGKASLNFTTKDVTLRRDIIIISTLVFLSASCEVFLLTLEYFPQFDNINGMKKSRNFTEGKSTLYTYYWRSNRVWLNYLGYHPTLAILAFLSQKFAVLSWNYVDVLGIILSRALYFKFQSLCQIAEEKLHEHGNENSAHAQGKTLSLSDRLTWINIVKDHETLCMLLSGFEAFLSPLIFGSYATNIYYVCMQLIDGLTPGKTQESLVYAIFAPWSFLHLLTRMLLLSIHAARINTYAHEIGSVLKRCPIELYDPEVSRIDRHVTAGPDIGLTGLGCFCVTKPFLLSMINVVFTVEIVLLQGLSTDTCQQQQLINN